MRKKVNAVLLLPPLQQEDQAMIKIKRCKNNKKSKINHYQEREENQKASSNFVSN